MSPFLRAVFFVSPLVALAAACGGKVVVDTPATGGGGATSSSTNVSTSGNGGFGATTTGSGGALLTSTSSSGAGGSGGFSPGGACTNDFDLQIASLKDLWPILVPCAKMFIGAEPQQFQCIQSGTGLTASCAACYDGYVLCALKACINECVSDQLSPPCIMCRQLNCDASLVACTGVAKIPGE